MDNLTSCIRDLGVDLGGLQMLPSELAERNFENMCHYHRVALKKIIKGAPSQHAITKKEKILLCKRGVILKRYTAQPRVYWIVSPKATEILKTF